MGSLIEELRHREEDARAEADRLRARIGELTEELARAEEQVTRLAITREDFQPGRPPRRNRVIEPHTF